MANCQKCWKDLVYERCVNQEEYWNCLGYPTAKVSVRQRSHETPELGNVIPYFSQVTTTYTTAIIGWLIGYSFMPAVATNDEILYVRH